MTARNNLDTLETRHLGRGALRFFPELFFLVTLAICASLSSHPAASVVSLGVFAAFLALLFAREPAFYLKYLPFLFAIVANIAGCTVCEFGNVNLGELATTSYFVGSLPALVLSRGLLVAILFAVDERFGVQVKTHPNRIPGTAFKERVVLFFEVLAFVLITVSYLHVAGHPSFLEGLDRFKYNDTYMTGIWSRLDMLLSYLVVFPIIAIRHNKRRVFGVATIMLYCLFLFWTGEKFGSFFTLACCFSYVFYDVAFSLTPKKKAVLGSSLCILFAGIIGLTLFAHSFTSNGNATDFLGQRIAQQGQLWWKAYDNCQGETHPSDFIDEVDALIENKSSIKENVGSNNGIYRIMYYTAPQEVVDRKLASGSRYTEGGYAAMYYYFGICGTLGFSIVMALLVFVIQNALIAAIWKRHPLQIGIFAWLSSLTRTGIGMLLFNRFLNWASIASYLYLAIERFLQTRKLHGCSKGTHAKRGTYKNILDALARYNEELSS